MAGLLKQPRQQEQQAPVQAQPAQAAPNPNEQMPNPNEQMPGGEGMDEGADENNPEFLAAVNQVKKALYQEGASDGANKALISSQDPVDTVATLAYELTAIADGKVEEGSGRKVPDELLVLLASTVLSEIVDIATASGIEMSAADIGEALKKMILRFMGEQGADTRGLEEAMNQVSPEQMNQIAAEVQ